MNRYGVIDIGTSSCLLLVAESDASGSLVPVYQESETTRLGEGMDSGRISRSPLERTLQTVRRFAAAAAAYGIGNPRIVGTEVFRRCKNLRETQDRLIDAVGSEAEVLSETDEAVWGYTGAVYGRPLEGTALVADVGGGSTELVLGKASGVTACSHVRLGALTLTERIKPGDPPSEEDMRRMRRAIMETVQPAVPEEAKEASLLLGIGGTAATLAAIVLNLHSYSPERVDGTPLSYRRMKALCARLSRMTVEEKKTMVPFDPSRADILLSGAMIVLQVMEASFQKTMTVASRGLRFGIALREAGVPRPFLKPGAIP